MSNNNCNRFCVGGFGMAAGVVWGGSLFLLGLVNVWCDWGGELVTFFSNLYVGYEATILGALIGGVWGFFDALVAGVVFALIYNCCAKCCCKAGKICCKRQYDTDSASTTESNT